MLVTIVRYYLNDGRFLFNVYKVFFIFVMYFYVFTFFYFNMNVFLHLQPGVISGDRLKQNVKCQQLQLQLCVITPKSNTQRFVK